MVNIMSNAHDEGQACYKVVTSSATYLYQKAAGGYSSLLDRDGNDWLGFAPHPTPSYPASAANAYRGMPNFCNGGAEHGLGHPGFTQAVSQQVDESTIESHSMDRAWRWRWTFFADYAQLDVLSVSGTRPYWFLFEGNPLGQFAPQHQFWMTDTDGLCRDKPDYVNGHIAYGAWRWLCLGDERVDRSLLLVQNRVYDPHNCFAFLGNSDGGVTSPDGMMVLGFGRGDEARAYLTHANTRFYVAFIEQNILDSRLADDINNIVLNISHHPKPHMPRGAVRYVVSAGCHTVAVAGMRRGTSTSRP